jgi:phosphoserine phosphatase
MNLVVQSGAPLAPALLDRLAGLTQARAIEHIDRHGARLIAAQRHDQLAPLCRASGVDHAWIADGQRLDDFGLFITDMDSTLINIECIDEMAALHGVRTEVAAITAAAMRGEFDYRAALNRRVALLAGLPERALAEVYDHRLQLNPGAGELLRGLKAAGIKTAMVSGGFTYFTERLKARLGFDHAWANQLEIIDGHLTGRVIGPIIDGEAKAMHLIATRDVLGLRPGQVICAGDGANDIPMLRAGGFGVAYRAKPALREAAACCIDHAGLDGILRLFGRGMDKKA